MITTLSCGCTIDDELKSTVHEADGRHYPIGTSPKTYCPVCDLFKPCFHDREPVAWWPRPDVDCS